MNTVLKFLDTKTGAIVEDFGPCSIWWWGKGNGSCDCNREMLFDVASEPEMENMCLGAERYICVDIVYADFEGMTKADAIAYINQDYPPELIEKFKSQINQ